MIKAIGTDVEGRPALIMGLTPGNLARLQEGDPIRFNARELGLPAMTVIIMFGESNEDINAALSMLPKAPR